MTKRFGRDRAALLAQSLSELDAVARLGDIDQLPYVKVSGGEHRREVVVESAQQLRVQLGPGKGQRGGVDGWRDWSAVVVQSISFGDQ